MIRSFLLLVIGPWSVAASPVVSEFMARNDSTIADVDGDFSDWIEIYNPDSVAVDLSRFFLTDNATNLQKWAFPAGTSLAPGGRLIVFASNKPGLSTPAEPHTNFKLGGDGEYLALVAANGIPVTEFAPTFPPQFADVSYGSGQVETVLVGENASARALIPTDGSLGDSWRMVAFDDSSWTTGLTGVGFDSGVAGGPLLDGQMASSGFAFAYEMDTAPNNQDLDSNSTDDWWDAAVPTVSGGFTDPAAGDGNLLRGDFSNSIWRSGVADGDYTLEFSVQVLNTGSEGSSGTLGIAAGVPSDVGSGTTDDFRFNIARSGIGLGSSKNDLDTADNTDGQHVIRIVRQAPLAGGQSRFWLWRDGVLLNASDTSPFAPNNAHGNTNYIFLGDFSSSLGGGYTIDYVRLTPGAFAPEGGALYAERIGLDVGAADTSVYVRIPFQATDTFDSLSLGIGYDDGFVAFLNGTEIAARNAPAVPLWNSGAVGARNDTEALTREIIPLNTSLINGTNVLAIHALNAGAGEERMLVDPILSGSMNQAGSGYLGTPTPGSPNSATTPPPAGEVTFSHANQAFATPFSLTMTTETPGAEIYYSTNGLPPGILYTGPLTVSTSTRVIAEVRLPGSPDGPSGYREFVRIGSDAAAFTSPIPVIVIDNFGDGTVPGKVVQLNPLVDPPGNDGGGIQQVTRQAAFMSIYDSGSLSAVPDIATRIGIRERGSSSSGLSKLPYSVETWSDEDENSRSISPFGMPSESDWVLYAPTEAFSGNRYDRPLLHNSFIYALSNQIGRYAPRTQFVEVFLNTGGGDVTMSDYAGLYIFMEKPKRDKGRVDFDEMSLDGTRGGWMLKVDRMDSIPEDDPNATPQHFHTPGPDGIRTTIPNDDHGIRPSGGQPDDHPAYYHSFFNFDSPNGYTINTPQRQAIEDYLFDFENALYGASWQDPSLGYAAWIDVGSFVDQYILHNLTKNQDAFVLSAFLYRESETAKLEFGPIWDFDRGYTTSPTNTNPTSNLRWADDRMWYPRLFDDINFEQAYIDRWQDLRRTAFSDASMAAIIDGQKNEVTEPVALRNGTVSWPTKVQAMKDYLVARTAAIDAQFLDQPIFGQRGGNVSAGFGVTLSSASGSIYYTTDGSDPRAHGGGLSTSALLYASSVQISDHTVFRARTKSGADWSGINSASFIIDAVPADATNLVISEISYRPALSTAAELDAGFAKRTEFEFVELMNVGSQTIDLGGVEFTAGLQFVFPDFTPLDPGERFVLAENEAAFAFRYGTPADARFAGELSNDGEQIVLKDAVGNIIHDFTYNDQLPWPTSADGDGSTLTLINPSALPDHALPENWRASAIAGGSPGDNDTDPFTGTPGALLAYALGELTASADGNLTLRFPMNPTAENITYIVETSPDLVNWSTGQMTYLGEINGQRTYQSTAGAAERLFGRVRVDLSTP